MNQDTKEMFFDFCQITDLVEYNKTSAVITSRETIAAAETAPVEEVTIDF